MDFIKLDQFDNAFDKATCFPLVSTATGAGRVVYGLVELITGIVRGIFYGIGQFKDDRCEKKFDDACLHIFFGGASIIKGVAEAIPLVNLLAYLYNTDFKPLRRCDWTAFTQVQGYPVTQPVGYTAR